jgi:hypothetical protein
MHQAVAAIVLATMVGCSGSTPTTKASSSTAPKATSSTKPKLVQATPSAEVTTAPLREGHALKVTLTQPASIQATNNGGAVSYLPDPPDAQVTLEVPETSLGARVNSLMISYAVSGQATSIPDQAWPMAPKQVYPGDKTVVAVPIGSALLKPLITGKNPPSVIQATVRFLDEGGEVIPDVDGNDLTAAVNVMVQ